MAEDQSPKVSFHPAPSVGHELGIMFGFIAFFLLSMGVYYTLWKGELYSACSGVKSSHSVGFLLSCGDEILIARCLSRHCFFPYLGPVLFPSPCIISKLTFRHSHSGEQTRRESGTPATRRFGATRVWK